MKKINCAVIYKVLAALLLFTFGQISAQGFYFPKITTETIRIMPLGNSITYGTGSIDLSGYRKDLYNHLIGAGYPVDFVGSLETGNEALFDNDHEGHGGWHADHPTLDRISILDSVNMFLRNAIPDIVLLHIGTNDLGEGQSAAGVAAEVDQILNVIDDYEFNYTRDVTVFLAQIINVKDATSERGIRTSIFNDSLQAIAARRVAAGDKLILVNQENALTSPDDFADNIHPNNSGYSKMANIWFQALDNYFKNENDQIIVTKQPQDKGAIEGDNVSFSVNVASAIEVNYQWFKNNTPVPGSNSPNFTLTNISSEDNNSIVFVRISNSTNEVYSNSAKLIVTNVEERVTNSLQVFYDFTEGDGSVVHDHSDNGDSLDLYINNLDAVEWSFEGLTINHNTIIASDSPGKDLADSVQTTNQITLEAWIRPDNLIQTGPARIFTMSVDAGSRNFTLGQREDDIEVRLRTTETTIQGSPSLITDQNFLTTEFTHLAYTWNGFEDLAKLYVNGQLFDSLSLGGDFSNWSDSMHLALGNEFIEDRTWLGTYNMVAVYNRALNENEILHNYEYGLIQPVLDAPTNLAADENNIGEVLLNWEDNSTHESGFYIERKLEDADSFAVIGSVGKNFSFYSDSTAEENIMYDYRVKAFNSTVESEYSNITSISPAIRQVEAPGNFIAEYLEEPDRVALSWVDKSFNEKGFVVERKIGTADSEYSVLDSLDEGAESYVDTTIENSTTYVYRVYAYSNYLMSAYSPSKVVNIPVSVEGTEEIRDFRISQNYPNPFNPTTKITFDIPEESNVSIEIFNSLGEKVINLVNDEISRGRYTVIFDGKFLSSGIYLYRISAKSLISRKEFHKISKMMLIK